MQPRGGELEYQTVKIDNFDGGLATAIGPLLLGSNQFAASLNIIPIPGHAMFRGGWSVYSAIPGAADAAFPFIDSSGNDHYMIWSNGSLYDAFGNIQLVEANCYTAGQNIGAVTDDGILYWSSGQPVPVPLRYWNPVAATIGAVIGSGLVGTVDPPASDFLFMYAGSIVALAPTWGIPLLPANVYQPVVFTYCNVNDPTSWVADNAQQVGSRDGGGKLIYGRQVGISDTGISPTRTMLLFRNDAGVYAYTGALGAQAENLLNCPVGLRDPLSVQFIPSRDQFGAFIWLGTDAQFWRSNGVNCLPISADAILPTLVVAYNSALSASTNPRFPSGYNEQWQYYWCSIGDIQFTFRWTTEAWALFQGWPVGPGFIAKDINGFPAQFIASNIAVDLNTDAFVVGSSLIGGPDVLGTTVTAFVLAQVARLGYADDGVMPSVYWKSPVIHCGDFDMFKKFHQAAISALDTGALYNVVGTGIRRSDGTVQTTKTIPLQAPNNSGNPFTLDLSLLDGPDVLADPLEVALGTAAPVVMQGRLAVETEVSEWWPEGMSNALEGTAMQLTVSYGGGAYAFDLLAAEIFFTELGYRRGGGTFFNPECITDAAFNPYLGFLNPAE